ncbi:Smr domain protein [Camillea tinctor]|nr:Smr domain protein [Camillea tinctor]
MSIPLTQVGGKAFNHSVGGDAEAEYDRLRDLARAEAQKRNSCFDRAHQAYERGDGAEAKELSNEGKRHAAKMDEYNKQASEYIFRENNAEGRVAEDTIDLHGQFVEEAEEILEQRIRQAQRQGQTHLHVVRLGGNSIVGKGNHSANHVQKLKPRVERVCQELGLQYATEENAGRIYVDLQGGDVSEMPPPSPLPAAPHEPRTDHGGGKTTHGGSGRPSQHHHQQEEEEDLISKFVRKLGECCVIM